MLYKQNSKLPWRHICGIRLIFLKPYNKYKVSPIGREKHTKYIPAINILNKQCDQFDMPTGHKT